MTRLIVTLLITLVKIAVDIVTNMVYGALRKLVTIVP